MRAFLNLMSLDDGCMMNTIPENTIVVSDIAGSTLKLSVQGEDLTNKMKSLGFYILVVL